MNSRGPGWFLVLPILFFSVSSPAQGPDRKDMEQIFRDANQGNPKAQLYLGSMYGNGKGVPLDHVEAAKWYRKAADQGYARAQWYLGLAYYNGLGLPRDHAEAAKWHRKAADQGFAEAQIELANLSYRGEGVPRDLAEAERWYRKAAEQGNAKAKDYLRRMDRREAKSSGVDVETVLGYLFFPFLLFILWGPFAFVYAARVITRRLSARFGATQAIQPAFFILVAIFLPVAVTSKGGNIPAIFPWWMAVLGMFTSGGIDLSIASFIYAVPVVPLIWYFVHREAKKNVTTGEEKSKA